MSYLEDPRFNLSGPPRWVPLLVRCRLMFGGGVTQLGWLFLGIGSIAFWALQIPSVVYQLVVFHAPFDTAPAEITTVTGTKAKEGKREVFRYEFKFQYAGGQHVGTSYETGSSLKQGETVIAELPQGRPDLARIQGKRATLFGPGVIFLSIFPLVGLGLMLGGSWRGRRALMLLAQGNQTTGRLIHRERTRSKVNNQPVYKLTFQFETDAGETCEAVAHTHNTELLTDDAEEQLLYHPRFPQRATLLDHLPGAPRIDENGELHVSRVWITLLCLILPSIVIGSNLAYVYWRFFS